MVILLPGVSHGRENHWKEFRATIYTNRVPAAEFNLPLLERRNVGLKDFKGKVVILNFWASWCPPCREEMPSLERLYKGYKDKGLLILGVNYMETPKKVKGFMKEFKLTFPTLLDKDGEVMREYMVVGIPTTFIIDKKGMVAGKVFGDREWDNGHAKALVEELIGE